eukprot:gene16710-biopygen23296
MWCGKTENVPLCCSSARVRLACHEAAGAGEITPAGERGSAPGSGGTAHRLKGPWTGGAPHTPVPAPPSPWPTRMLERSLYRLQRGATSDMGGGMQVDVFFCFSTPYTRRKWCPETVVEKLDYSPRPPVSFARPERAWPNDLRRVGRTKCRGCLIHLRDCLILDGRRMNRDTERSQKNSDAGATKGVHHIWMLFRDSDPCARAPGAQMLRMSDEGAVREQ